MDKQVLKEKIFKKEYILLGFMLILSCLPLFLSGIEDRDGQDLVFHLLRIEGIADGLKAGECPVRMQSNWLDGYGYPVSVFYGDLLLYIPAVLRILGFKVLTTYKIFVLFINFATLLISRWSFKRIYKNDNIAIICSIAYVFASYRLVNVYARQAVGEYTALMFIPIVAAAIYGLYTEDDSDWKKYSKNSIILAVGMTGLINTHILSTEMVVIVMAVVFIFFIKKSLRKSTIKAYLKAVFISVLLNVAFLVPFIDYSLNENTNIISGTDQIREIQFDGVRLWDYFGFFRSPFGHTYTDVAKSGGNLMMLTPGMLLIVVFVIGIVVTVQKKGNKKITLFTLFAGVSLWVASSMFPWNFIAHSIPGGGLLTQVQFPWRYLVIADIFLVLLLGALCQKVSEFIRNILVYIVVLISIITVASFQIAYIRDANITYFNDEKDLNTFYIGREEYLVKGTKSDELKGEVYGTGIVESKVIDARGTAMTIAVKTDEEEAYLVAPKLNYSGYQVSDSDGKNYEIENGPNNEIAINIAPKFDGNIYIKYKEPIHWRIAEVISVVMAIIVLIYLVRDGRDDNKIKR